MIGDSAGGNLIMSVSLKLVQLGVKRIPDGIVTVYSPFLFQVTYEIPALIVEINFLPKLVSDIS